jgi:hypothetical protein
MRVRVRDTIVSYIYRLGGEEGGATSPRMPPMFSVSVGVERCLRERAWWRTTAHPPRAECRSSPFVSFDSKVLLALWGLLGCNAWEVLLVIAVWDRR